MNYKTISYYPGLNELRALAALSIIPGHIEQVKGIFGLEHTYWFPIPGKWAVVLFFVISGFLITTLLLKEKELTKSIDLKRFYMKRMLRIWPLYFLIMAVSILLLNHINTLQILPYSVDMYDKLKGFDIVLILAVLPHYLSVLIPYASQTWSIGIEEQFYLIQPVLLKIINNLWMFACMMFLVLFSYEIIILYYPHDRVLRPWSVYFGAIAVGALSALMCYRYPRMVTRVIHHIVVQVGVLVLFALSVVMVWIRQSEQVVDFRLLALLFAVVVVNAATNPNSFYNLKSRWLDYLGRISYGIYIYHAVAIVVALRIVQSLSPVVSANTLFFQVAVYGLTFVLVIGVSALSYRYFEQTFLAYRRDKSLHQ